MGKSIADVTMATMEKMAREGKFEDRTSLLISTIYVGVINIAEVADALNNLRETIEVIANEKA